MLGVHMQLELKAPPEEVWKVIGGFDDVHAWVPPIQKCTVNETGTVRTLSLPDGGEIVEQLEKRNDEDHYYRYSIIESTLPLSNYVATLRVNAQAGGAVSIVDWSSHFNADNVTDEEAVAIVRGVYQAGFDELQRIFAE